VAPYPQMMEAEVLPSVPITYLRRAQGTMICRTRKAAVLSVFSQVCGANQQAPLCACSSRLTTANRTSISPTYCQCVLLLTVPMQYRICGADSEDCTGHLSDSWGGCLVSTPLLVCAGNRVVLPATGEFVTSSCRALTFRYAILACLHMHTCVCAQIPDLQSIVQRSLTQRTAAKLNMILRYTFNLPIRLISLALFACSGCGLLLLPSLSPMRACCMPARAESGLPAASCARMPV